MFLDADQLIGHMIVITQPFRIGKFIKLPEDCYKHAVTQLRFLYMRISMSMKELRSSCFNFLSTTNKECSEYKKAGFCKLVNQVLKGAKLNCKTDSEVKDGKHFLLHYLYVGGLRLW